jgi:hypothetical protein
VPNQEQALTWDVETRLAAVTYTNRTASGGSGQLPITCNGAPRKRVFLPLVMNQSPAERHSYDAAVGLLLGKVVCFRGDARR